MNICAFFILFHGSCDPSGLDLRLPRSVGDGILCIPSTLAFIRKARLGY